MNDDAKLRKLMRWETLSRILPLCGLFLGFIFSVTAYYWYQVVAHANRYQRVEFVVDGIRGLGKKGEGIVFGRRPIPLAVGHVGKSPEQLQMWDYYVKGRDPRFVSVGHKETWEVMYNTNESNLSYYGHTLRIVTPEDFSNRGRHFRNAVVRTLVPPALALLLWIYARRRRREFSQGA